MIDKTNKLKILNNEIDKIPGRFKGIMKQFIDTYGATFIIAPASTKYHHAYPGGLYDHTLEVLNGVRSLGKVFPELDMEVAETGAALHDIGKVVSYQYNKPTKTGKIPALKYKRTPESGWIGDIGESLRLSRKFFENDVLKMMVENNENKGIEDTFNEILHIIASHHGEVRRGWGSLVNPQTAEAQVVHFVDMISSRVRTNIPEDMDWQEIFEIEYPEVFSKDKK